MKIAPIRDKHFLEKPWEGNCSIKPWEYKVSVVIPCLDAFNAVSEIVKLYKLQTEKPFIILIDTGSTVDELYKLQSLADEDCEVHSLRLNGVKHPSDFPAMAMDLAFGICRTEFMLTTHADCFPMSKKLIEDMLKFCNEKCPVAGYEITERKHSDWRGMVGHTMTIFHMPSIDSIDGAWSMRRLISNFKHPDGIDSDYNINPATSPNWPDTELLINYQCRKNGIVPLIIGYEKNATRTLDSKIDHCRSWISAKLYSNGSSYEKRSNGWLENGIKNARERYLRWKME